jgi:protein SCO1/2
LAAAVLLVGAWTGSKNHARTELPYYDAADFTPRWSLVSHRVGGFALLRQTGEGLREADLDGRIHVASFIFTTCPNLCPILVERLRRVQDGTRGWADVRLVSYTVAPATDTPSVLAAFGAQHGIDPGRWWLATGDRAEIARLARESYFAEDERPLEGKASSLLHSERLLLVDRSRRLRGVYNGSQPFEIERLLEDIQTLEKEGVS